MAASIIANSRSSAGGTKSSAISCACGCEIDAPDSQSVLTKTCTTAASGARVHRDAVTNDCENLRECVRVEVFEPAVVFTKDDDLAAPALGVRAAEHGIPVAHDAHLATRVRRRAPGPTRASSSAVACSLPQQNGQSSGAPAHRVRGSDRRAETVNGRPERAGLTKT